LTEVAVSERVVFGRIHADLCDLTGGLELGFAATGGFGCLFLGLFERVRGGGS
jgi:hypothetical protein